MIGYIEGKLLQKKDDRILVLANQVGYEVLLPDIVMATIHEKSIGDEISFYIFYHQTERQPRPVLIGFNFEVEKEFFQYFISVEDIGPLKALKALSVSVRDIARAIEAKDVGRLKQLKGIGNRTAQKIVATLEGKMGKFALISEKGEKDFTYDEDITEHVLEVLVSQLGYKKISARQMIAEALKRNSSISTSEALFEEVYRGVKSTS
jgi:Holliday junction DNA helicase RuvA